MLRFCRTEPQTVSTLKASRIMVNSATNPCQRPTFLYLRMLNTPGQSTTAMESFWRTIRSLI
jgi:hypothetical protein